MFTLKVHDETSRELHELSMKELKQVSGGMQRVASLSGCGNGAGSGDTIVATGRKGDAHGSANDGVECDN